MSNGYPMAAVIGTRDVMEAAQDAFISSTYWTERVGPTAALATIRKLMECNVPHHLIHAGSRVQQGWRSLAQKHGILINVTGIEPLGSFSFNYNKKELLLKTLFTQFMLEKGYLAGTAFYASFAHTDKIIDGYLRNVDEAFAFIAEALDKDDLEGQLKGPVCHAGFQRLN
jgi:glutamate-1-semialdehyde 2,1-aminomutase